MELIKDQLQLRPDTGSKVSMGAPRRLNTPCKYSRANGSIDAADFDQRGHEWFMAGSWRETAKTYCSLLSPCGSIGGSCRK